MITMRDKIAEALKGHGADYVEIRLEESSLSRIVYRGERLEEVGRSSGVGGNVRALVKGGWGFVSFNSMDDLKSKVALAVSQAKIVGSGSSNLAAVEPVVDIVPAQPADDPALVPLEEKKELLDGYNSIIMGTSGIKTSSIRYHDGHKKVRFASSEGTYIEQEKVDLNLGITAIASAGGNIQQVSLSTGSNGDYSSIKGMQEEVKDMAQRAVNLLTAPKADGGTTTVVLDPILAGVFVHEAFGHLSESDFVYENDRLKEMMVLGRRFGGKHLNIVDGAAVPGLRGSYKYDDEGTPARKTYLIREGILEGRLHSRETAGIMDELPTGNARAINYLYPPIVRMTNTYIEPGKAPLADMIGEIKDGIYARGWYGGTTSLEMFTFSAGEAYRIRNGKIAELLQPVVLTGNVFDTLHNIDAIGDDLEMNQGGGCGKEAQSPLPVSNGSPHIRIRNCLIGGS